MKSLKILLILLLLNLSSFAIDSTPPSHQNGVNLTKSGEATDWELIFGVLASASLFIGFWVMVSDVRKMRKNSDKILSTKDIPEQSDEKGMTAEEFMGK